MERRWLVYPYHLWMLLFTVAPLALIFFFAFTNQGSWTFTLEISGRRRSRSIFGSSGILSGWRRWLLSSAFLSAIRWR